ncbi:Protein of unknown function [Robiginitalea myxolifaciens]|uniref:DUF998 domain-containing protein n=1 Tax=Robiginitalea myxolifaciens TaxID=400055 RepID=A0A1I6HCI7_9FLAO|nr:DUF998 domain-containing protein [Robiginitalea myxolifaciens]SFR52081.1 Protein of unknown function [Robiginitalea myxolifaciens]
MNTNRIFWIGIIGVSLFVLTAIVGGLLIEGYSPVSQLISESYAIDTAYGGYLRAIGYIPSGILIALFCFKAAPYFRGFKLTRVNIIGIGIFYGLATVVVSIFPCDSGCNTDLIDPSISQLIHNLMGILTYLFAPVCILLTGVGTNKSDQFRKFSRQAIMLGFLSFASVGLLIGAGESDYVGLIQRVVEATFVLWVFSCAFALRSGKQIQG